MLIRNKKQDTVWDISDEAVVKRLLAKPGEYEEVGRPAEPVKPDPKKPEKSGP